MVEIYSQKTRPFLELPLGIVISGSEEQRHVGLFYRTADTLDGRYLHLAFHLKLTCEAIPNDGQLYWLPLSSLDQEEQRGLAAWAHTIWEKNGNNVPYGINFSRSRHFNNDGAHTSSIDDGGLTCATFILAIFSDHGFPIINTATSYRRDSDEIWQKQILTYLNGRASQEYIERQQDFLGQAARYRPEEVAGAASVFNGELSFDVSIQLGELVLQKLREMNALTA